jgi:gliding motility-associated-like protein
MSRCLYALLCIVLCGVSPVFVKAQLNAEFTSNIVGGCSPILVNFTDQSTGTPSSWLWNLGNGTSSTLQNPSTTYITPGTYTVTLTVSNGSSSNTQTSTNYITVIATPVINFIGSDTTTLCPPALVSFTNLTVPGTSGTISWLWDFGDGSTSTQTNPAHTYASPGNFNVTLSATNGAGCPMLFTKPQYIHIAAKPAANFTAPATGSCSSPFTANFTNTTSGGISGGVTYQWSFGDGGTSTSTNPNHTYTTPGAYTVTLIATNASGCKDTAKKPAFISIGNVSAAFTKSTNSVCAGDSVIFINTSTPGPGNSTWNFGDGGTGTGTVAAHAYNNAGTYVVKLTADYTNCSDTQTSTVTVITNPHAAFTATNNNGCTTPLTVSFNNNSTGSSNYSWSFGDGGTSTQGNPSHTYTSPGSYTVRLIAINTNGCRDTLVITNFVNIIQPTGIITVSPLSVGCAPLTAGFTASLSTPSPITGYNWNFGGTGTSTSAAPTHTFATPGVYTITLNYTTSSGCTGTLTFTPITVGTPPVPSFTAGPATVCPNQVVTFTNTSTAPAGTVYTWNYGDGSLGIDPYHTYGATGTYTPSLIATYNGCQVIYVLPQVITVLLPTANFDAVYYCSNRKKIFCTDNSVGADTWLWNFGDGTTSTQQNPTHTYANFGTYLVTLHVTNAQTGCSDDSQQPVFLFGLDAQFTANDTNVCIGQPITFTTNHEIVDSSYVWDFGDGTTQIDPAPDTSISHTYQNPGNYAVRLILKSLDGCTDTLLRTNYITVTGPHVNFGGVPVSGCVPLNVLFTDMTTTNGGAIASKIWRFGDGAVSTSVAPTVSHTYGPGTYSITVIETDVNGCTDSLKRINYVTASSPVASFTGNDTTVCPGTNVTFSNTSTGDTPTYQWSFGDGTTSTATNPVHAYINGGSYTVRLIVTTASGCKDTLIRTNYIDVNSIDAGFTLSDTFATCPPLTVNFVNSSVGGSVYIWTFGNGNTSSFLNPTNVYTTPGIYTVKLKVLNGTSCKDSITRTVTVLGPTGTLSYSPVNGCSPLTVQFASTNTNTQQLVWDMDNGVTQTTTASSTTYTYTHTGSYLPKLLLSDGQSCIVPILGTDTIKVDSLSSGFSFTPDSLCQSGTIQFFDTAFFALNPIVSRSWVFGDGSTSTAHNPSHTYASPGSYNARLIMGTNQGCLDTIIKTVTILTAPAVSAGSNQAICLGQTTSVQLQATGASSYTWSPSTSLSCTSCANPTANPNTGTVYTVIGTDIHGCVDTSQVTVSLNTLPIVSAGPGQTVCAGSSVQLLATGANSYSWTPTAGLSCTNCANPVANPATTTTYIVTGTAANGCTDTGMVTITVNSAPPVSAGNNVSYCTGGSTQLQASGALSYVWSPSTGLSCTTCPNPIANPSATTTYTVTGTSAAGCPNTSQVTVTVNAQPSVSAANVSMCIGGSAQLLGTGASAYTWSPQATLSCNNCPNPVATPAGTTTYTVIGTSGSGCPDTSQVTVTVNGLPVVNAGNNDTVCLGSAIQLQATGAATYSWTPSSTLSCANCQSPNAAPSGNTTYTVVGTDANGCTDIDDVTINVNLLPTVDAGPDQSMCKIGSVQLEASGAATYSWTPATTLSCNNCSNPSASPASQTTYTVTGTDAGGCSNTDQVTVNIFPDPVINAGPDRTICRGELTQLNATGGQSYVWSPATDLSCVNCPSPFANPSGNITYTVTGTDINGCAGTDDVSITVLQMEPFIVGPGDTLCQGESAQLFASGGNEYLWIPATGLSDPNIPNPVATPDVTTTYTLITKQGGCFSDTTLVTVIVHPQPTVDAGGDQTIFAGSTVALFANATHTTIFDWTPEESLSCDNCASPLASPKKNTRYIVYVANQYGCKSQDSVNIFILCNDGQVFVPNTFTPNGDGSNDRFYPSGKGLAVVKRLRVFNRWGELMYDANNIPLNDEMNGWDGSFKGEPLKPDVYVYILDAICETGEAMQFKGDVSIVR